jgi:predicted RNase H-like nuclease (RuvC/YqgF family)
MSEDTHLDEERGERGELSRRHSRHGEFSARMEEELKSLVQDETKLAREILMLKKELNRLHFKVKNYHKESRMISAIVNSIVIGLLLVITYRLFMTQ